MVDFFKIVSQYVCFIKKDLKNAAIIDNYLYIREFTKMWNPSVCRNAARNQKLNMREQL